MNEVQYYEDQENYYMSICNEHCRKYGIEDGLKYSEEHGLDCVDMPCYRDCPLDKKRSMSKPKSMSKRHRSKHMIPYWLLITALFWATYLKVSALFIFPALVATTALILDVYVSLRRYYAK